MPAELALVSVVWRVVPPRCWPVNVLAPAVRAVDNEVNRFAEEMVTQPVYQVSLSDFVAPPSGRMNIEP